jgi:hypothetical protein
MTSNDAGKGDSPRPFGVPMATYFDNYESTFKKKEVTDFENPPEPNLDISSAKGVKEDFGGASADSTLGGEDEPQDG